jgi:hypothetical protein
LTARLRTPNLAQVIARAVVVLVLAAVFAPAAAPLTSPWYSGTIRFRGAEPSNVTLKLSRTSATVTLAPGHVAHADVALKRSGNQNGFPPNLFATATEWLRQHGLI